VSPIEISGYDQMKVEPLCTSKLQTFEKFSKLFCRYMTVQSLKFDS